MNQIFKDIMDQAIMCEIAYHEVGNTFKVTLDNSEEFVIATLRPNELYVRGDITICKPGGEIVGEPYYEYNEKFIDYLTLLGK